MRKQSWPVIQVALDILDMRRALKVAKMAASAGVEWLEAGTPLIKGVGMHAVQTLSRTFPGNTVVADMKTLDAGEVECNMAFRSGAGVVSISGLAHNRTVRDSVQTASKLNGLLMADLLMSPNPRKRAKELEGLGVDIVCLHTGIDAQKDLHSKLKVSPTVREIARSLHIPVAAAGGITPNTVEHLVAAGVRIIIVGGWITGSKDPAHASRQIVEAVRDATNL